MGHVHSSARACREVKLGQAMPDHLELVAVVESARYDEATCLMTVKQDSGIPEFSEHVNKALDHIGKMSEFKETVPAKMFQTQHSYGFLFAVRQPGSESRRHAIIRTNVVGLPT
eukprot:5955906-Pyramimonas_sp.AAC.1